MNPDDLEKTLATKIDASLKSSPDDTLLGFLDIGEELQNSALEVLKGCSGFNGLIKLLRTHPALATYGLSVAAPIGLQDEDVGAGAFYEAWRSAIGMFPSQPDREPLAQAFIHALNRLGLPSGTISPEHEIHWHGGCYLFHAAILPHFVGPLQAALAAAQQLRPMPDLEDDEMSSAFAHLLAQNTAQAQQRLKRVLESKVGSFLVKRVVRWHLTRDDTLFPAHIRKFLVEQRGQVAFLRSPYVAFDEMAGRLQLVLPAQTPAVADAQTRWTVGALAPLRASSERPPISLDEITSEPTFEVKLSQLRGDLKDITYQIESRFSAERGFRLFDATTGKERKASTGELVDLTPGQTYLVVFDDASSVVSDHQVESAGELRYVRLEVTPRSEPLVIQRDSRTWTLKPKFRPGLFVSREEARVFHVNRVADGHSIPVTYGDGLALTCCVASESTGRPKLTFSSTSGALHCFEPCNPDSSVTGMALYDVGAELRNWLQALPEAVHAITATLESDGRKMTHELYFWKGLERISRYGDFYCSSLPVNLAQISGFDKRDSVIVRKQGYNGRPELAFRNLGMLEVERWEVPANRVKIVVVQNTGTPTELDERAEVDVLPDDDRVIQFRTGGLAPIRLSVNGTTIGEVSPEKPLLSKFLSSLVAAFGKAGKIKAECVSTISDEKPWSVLYWRTPQAAVACCSEDSPNDQARWLIKKISTRGITCFRVKLTDIAKRIRGLESEACFELSLSKADGSSDEIEPVPGLTCSLSKLDDVLVQIRIRFTQSAQPDAVLLLEVECLLEGNADWHPLLCCEAYSRLSIVRVLLIGKGNRDAHSTPFSELFWGRISGALPHTALAWQLTGDDFFRWLDTARWLIESRHPTDVWKQNGTRFKSLYERLSAVGLRLDQIHKTEWWSHAISTLNHHAMEPQPVIVPCLLMACGWQLASTSLVGCSPKLPVTGIVSRTFREAFTYENHGEPNDLNYLRGACGSRVAPEYLTLFTGWLELVRERPVALGRFKYNSWLESLRKHCGNEMLSSETDGIVLLSSQHLVYCLFKAMQRTETLIGVSSKEHGQWLSGPISSLQTSGDTINGAVTSTLIGLTGGITIDSLWNSAKQVPFTRDDEQRRELLSNLMGGACLLALLFRARSRNLIDSATQERRLKSLMGNRTIDLDVTERISTQIAIVLGTAPELFAFYFLHFTLSLPKQP